MVNYYIYTALLGFLSITGLSSQNDILISKQSKTQFFSSTPLEDIYAISLEAKGMIHKTDGRVSVQIPITSFKFDRPIMEEHFNDEYMESHKHPYAVFRGVIENIADIDFKKNGEHNIILDGDLHLHGVTKTIKVHSQIIIKDGKVFCNAKFKVHLDDHHIKRPELVLYNIADIIGVDINIEFEEQEHPEHPNHPSKKQSKHLTH